ncbi:MAG TPA: molybdenum cofactor biosynthesis protein MoaE [Acetobacteraceae bacterium]|nr:molybdenum cofactor biosynthesis protein MoaE [Acetobacteraceae bacterium]
MARILVQEADFDTGAEIARLTAGRADIGGIGCFVGTVRARAGERTITALTLEHYPAMTEAALARIAAEAARRWDLLGCTLIHRVGRLRPGDNIVLVLAASAHRQAALEATAFLIDWLKTKAPFWKKESFADGREAWVAAREADEAAASRWDVSPLP